MKNKLSTLMFILLIFGAYNINAQITILEEDVQEKIVSKPRVFDSLSNITYQKDPIQYKQYFGYKLYSLPVSSKYKCPRSNCLDLMQEFKYKSPREYIIPHVPYEQSSVGMVHNNMVGYPRDLYQKDKEKYEKTFVITTDIYKATDDGTVFDIEPSYPHLPLIYNSYDSIQNTYFTVLNIELADGGIAAKKGQFSALEEFDGDCHGLSVLRFTLKNEKNGDELYWVLECRNLKSSCMFLVPYFEKMQKTYKGRPVVSTKQIEKLADINTGEMVNIQPGEVWQCYDVTFVNTKKHQFIQPFFLLEKNGAKVMISFDDFTVKYEGILTRAENGYTYYPQFILEQDYNEIIAQRQRTAEERQRLAEERQRQEELAQQEHNKQIIQKYGNKYGKLICEGKVCLNMTKEMCLEAWGEPLYINSTIVKGLTHEQWVYGWHNYLYFDNNVLTAIQN